jgi:ribonucleotide monophosphatase NagD (HAD superfamily)
MVFDRNSFGIAFDIDGVLIRGGDPLGRAPDALRRLYRDVKKGNHVHKWNVLRPKFYFR